MVYNVSCTIDFPLRGIALTRYLSTFLYVFPISSFLSSDAQYRFWFRYTHALRRGSS